MLLPTSWRDFVVRVCKEPPGVNLARYTHTHTPTQILLGIGGRTTNRTWGTCSAWGLWPVAPPGATSWLRPTIPNSTHRLTRSWSTRFVKGANFVSAKYPWNSHKPIPNFLWEENSHPLPLSRTLPRARRKHPEKIRKSTWPKSFPPLFSRSPKRRLESTTNKRGSGTHAYKQIKKFSSHGERRETRFVLWKLFAQQCVRVCARVWRITNKRTCLLVLGIQCELGGTWDPWI